MARGNKGRKIPRPPKPQLTHFLCVPLVFPAVRAPLEASLSKFRDDARRAGVPSAAIRPVGSLHLTIGVMSLLTRERLESAMQLLKSVDTLALQAGVPPGAAGVDAGPFTTSLRSLYSMHEPTQTSILYTAPDDPSDILLNLCSQLRATFTDAGFMIPDDRPVKLHATVLNTIYVKRDGWRRRPLPATGKESGKEHELDSDATAPETTEEQDETSHRGSSASAVHNTRASSQLRVDATSLLEQWKDHIWAGPYGLESITICKMGAKKQFGPDGAVVDEVYEEVSSLRLCVASGP